MTKIITTTTLPHQVIQLFSPGLLSTPMPKGEECRKREIELLLKKTLKKIRPQDTSKKKQYDRLVEMLEGIYEWKKNEAEKERASRKEGKTISSIPGNDGITCFRRMGTKT